MAKRIVKEGIVVVRDGKRVRPAINKAFDFTAEEIKQLEDRRPQAIAKLNEVEVDEKSTDVDGDGAGGDKTPAKTEAKTPATKGTAKAKAATKTDGSADGAADL